MKDSFYTYRVVWSYKVITHTVKKGRMIPIHPRVVWEKEIVKVPVLHLP